MNRLRWQLLLGILVISALLGYFLREVVYQLVVVPVAYLVWLLGFYYSAIPQWILWAVLIGVLFITVLWGMLPSVRFRSRTDRVARRAEGDVEALARWISRAQHGTYFKWQLANRLGRIARRLDELSGARGSSASPDPEVEKYLDAGLNYSFVDFQGPRSRFERPPRTPLDIDPGKVADYLESQMEQTSERHQ